MRPHAPRTAPGVVLALAALLSASALAGPVPDTDKSIDLTPVPRLELPPGERLTYEIRWSGLPAGQAVLSVKWTHDFDGHECYHVACEAKSNAFVESVCRYPVKDEHVSYIDARGAFSRFFRMSKKEGKIRRNEKIRFDYDKNIAYYTQSQPGPFPTKSVKRVRIRGRMQDPLSCLYYLRAVELDPGMSVKMKVHTARRQWDLTVESLRREDIEIPAFGTVRALRVEPSMSFPGIFVRKGRMVVWIEEKTHIPVLMHVDIPIGSVTVTLSGAENSPLERALKGEDPKETPKRPAGRGDSVQNDAGKPDETDKTKPEAVGAGHSAAGGSSSRAATEPDAAEELKTGRDRPAAADKSRGNEPF